MTSKLFVLVTGKAKSVAKVVIEGLEPEVEVIHFTLIANIESELPLLLQGKVPPKPSSTLGSGNLETSPVALLLGGAYDDATIDKLRKLVYDVPGTWRIPWLRVDASKPGPSPATHPEEYGNSVARRMKVGLVKLEGEGRLNGGDEGVYFV